MDLQDIPIEKTDQPYSLKLRGLVSINSKLLEFPNVLIVCCLPYKQDVDTF